MTKIDGLTAGLWTIDPTHTDVRFSVRHLAISKVRGTFDEFAGEINVGEEVEDTTMKAHVVIASVNTNQAQRDEHLRTGDFFAADEHPTMDFVSDRVDVKGDDLLVHGDLTLRGVTKPVTFTVDFGGVTTDGYGNTKAGFEATTKINRHDFGVAWNATTEAGGLTLGDDVTITIEGQAALQA